MDRGASNASITIKYTQSLSKTCEEETTKQSQSHLKLTPSSDLPPTSSPSTPTKRRQQSKPPSPPQKAPHPSKHHQLSKRQQPQATAPAQKQSSWGYYSGTRQ